MIPAIVAAVATLGSGVLSFVNNNRDRKAALEAAQAANNAPQPDRDPFVILYILGFLAAVMVIVYFIVRTK